LDVLYHRWGSFPNFQRTRGILRLLSLVINSLKDTSTHYISLADFDLSKQELRHDLIKHIGDQYNSVLAQDITDVNACSKVELKPHALIVRGKQWFAVKNKLKLLFHL
jgi:predicted AAA+ superfamily ATPase